MYKFIFYFIYKSQINQKDGGPVVAKIVGSMFVFTAMIFHISLLYSITRFIMFNYQDVNISFSMGKTYSSKMLIFSPIFLILSITAIKYFNKNRIAELLTQYQDIKIYSLINIVKFFAIFLLPLIASIMLIKRSVV